MRRPYFPRIDFTTPCQMRNRKEVGMLVNIPCNGCGELYGLDELEKEILAITDVEFACMSCLYVDLDANEIIQAITKEGQRKSRFVWEEKDIVIE